MAPSDPTPRRPLAPASRDAALRRTRRATGVVLVGAAGLSGVFSAVAAQAFKGQPKTPSSGGAVAVAQPTGTTVPGPQHVPAIAARPTSAAPPPAPPTAAPVQQAPVQQAPVQQAAVQQAPVQQAAPPPPVVSGGS